MLKLPQDVRDRYDLSTLGRAVHAAAPCPIWAKEQMIEWWGPILIEYYGATEGNGSTQIDSKEWLAHRGAVGRPVRNCSAREPPPAFANACTRSAGRPARLLPSSR